MPENREIFRQASLIQKLPRRRQPPEENDNASIHADDGTANCGSGDSTPVAADGPRAPKSVSVVLGGETLVVTLHGALSPAEQAMAQSPEGAAKVQEFHRRLFQTASETIRLEITRITGVDVREASVEMEPTTGTVVQVFTTGTMVQVFLLAQKVAPGAWTESGPGDLRTKKQVNV